jgi:Sec-independent protein translocase protein TatA
MGRSLGAGMRGFKDSINGAHDDVGELSPASTLATEHVPEPATQNDRIRPAA